MINWSFMHVKIFIVFYLPTPHDHAAGVSSNLLIYVHGMESKQFCLHSFYLWKRNPGMHYVSCPCCVHDFVMGAICMAWFHEHLHLFFNWGLVSLCLFLGYYHYCYASACGLFCWGKFELPTLTRLGVVGHFSVLVVRASTNNDKVKVMWLASAISIWQCCQCKDVASYQYWNELIELREVKIEGCSVGVAKLDFFVDIWLLIGGSACLLSLTHFSRFYVSNFMVFGFFISSVSLFHEFAVFTFCFEYLFSF